MAVLRGFCCACLEEPRSFLLLSDLAAASRCFSFSLWGRWHGGESSSSEWGAGGGCSLAPKGSAPLGASFGEVSLVRCRSPHQCSLLVTLLEPWRAGACGSTSLSQLGPSSVPEELDKLGLNVPSRWVRLCSCLGWGLPGPSALGSRVPPLRLQPNPAEAAGRGGELEALQHPPSRGGPGHRGQLWGIPGGISGNCGFCVGSPRQRPWMGSNPAQVPAWHGCPG